MIANTLLRIEPRKPETGTALNGHFCGSRAEATVAQRGIEAVGRCVEVRPELGRDLSSTFTERFSARRRDADGYVVSRLRQRGLKDSTKLLAGRARCGATKAVVRAQWRAAGSHVRAVSAAAAGV